MTIVKSTLLTTHRQRSVVLNYYPKVLQNALLKMFHRFLAWNISAFVLKIVMENKLNLEKIVDSTIRNFAVTCGRSNRNLLPDTYKGITGFN